ncbi:MAG: heme lyase CcmF/NrfE family subunit [Thermoleophilia bacterium]|nr:heme lyase CcmF/NrfE family subunit [Thermoleophilia bacterium]
MLLLGRLALSLALVLAVAAAVFLAYGMKTSRRDFIRNGYYATYGFALAAVIASIVLLHAFLGTDLGFAYVFENSDPSLSTFYRIAGFWAGQEGSFLLWLLMLAVVAVMIAAADLARLRRLVAGAVMVLAVNVALFAALMVLDEGSNPFLATPAGAGSPIGLNPLLLHPAMVLHPPALFAGYVGFAVPFAFAISALLLGRADREWVVGARRWAVGGWLMLSLGIGLGAWWAYVVLAFGGYWAWDPVESGSLVPWLTGTALLHSMTLYARRGIFKRWALGLAAATFWLTLVATWTTRTGVIQSVHAFGQRPLLVWFLTGVIVGVAALSAALIAWRWRRFESDREFESLASREFIYHLMNLTFTMFALAIGFSSVLVPLLFQRTVGPATYDLFAQPLGVATLALIALCPLFAWRRTDGMALRRSLVLPLAVAALCVPLWLFLGFQSNAWGFVGFFVCGFSLGAVLQFVLVSARRGVGGRPWTAGLRRALLGSRTRTAGYIAHLGMVLVVAGLLGSAVYEAETSSIIPATPGAVVEAGDYTLMFTGMRSESGAQGSLRAYAAFDVFSAGGDRVGSVEPHTDIYPTGMSAVRAVILGRPFEDVFVVTDQGFNEQSEELAVRVVVFPLIRWVWIGSILLCVGAAVSLWPRGQRQEQEARDVAAAREDGRLERATA